MALATQVEEATPHRQLLDHSPPRPVPLKLLSTGAATTEAEATAALPGNQLQVRQVPPVHQVPQAAREVLRTLAVQVPPVALVAQVAPRTLVVHSVDLVTPAKRTVSASGR